MNSRRSQERSTNMFAMPSGSRLQRILGGEKPNPRQKQHRPKSFRPCLEQLEERRLLYAGMLDHAFGTDGMAGIDLSGGMNGGTQVVGNAAALQADGKIVVVGTEFTNPNNTETFVARFNSDGSLDNSFGSSGTETVLFNAPSAGKTVAIQCDGKIVIAADVNTTLNAYQIGIARLYSSGALDIAFGPFQNGVAYY